eukprot:4533353-Prymnesium_polylepis.1
MNVGRLPEQLHLQLDLAATAATTGNTCCLPSARGQAAQSESLVWAAEHRIVAARTRPTLHASMVHRGPVDPAVFMAGVAPA